LVRRVSTVAQAWPHLFTFWRSRLNLGLAVAASRGFNYPMAQQVKSGTPGHRAIDRLRPVGLACRCGGALSAPHP
jgi:hypothetical protein